MAVELITQSQSSSVTIDGSHSPDLSPVGEKKSAEPHTAEVTGAEEDGAAFVRDVVPDGGLVAWLQVAGAFALYFNSWGFVNTFGVYQTYYELHLLSTSTPDTISWIGSVQAFLLLATGLISGPMFDGGYFRTAIIIGSFLVCFGTMMTSLATQYWHALLSQAFCIGIGGGFLCVPALSLLTQYFSRKQALATGITVIGSSFGGVIYPLAFQGLVDKVGFGWANRVLGFVSLATSSFAVIVMRQRVKPRKVRSLVDWSAFRDPSYNFFCTAMFFMNLGFMVPIVYLQIYAMSHGLTNENIALHLVAILNAASIPGRLGTAFIVPIIGPINTMLLITSLVTIVTLSWMAVNSAAGNILFAIAYGFASGGIVSLPVVVLSSITPDLRFVGARLGTSFVMTAAASLSGTPIAGAILRTTGKYIGIQLFAGLSVASGVLSVLAIRLSRRGVRLLDKA